ncbi:MAG: ComEC/Rec2 family competence protein [Patescibacteria group bacterium]
MSQRTIAVLLSGFIVGVLLRSLVNFGWAGSAFFVFLGIIILFISFFADSRKFLVLIALFLIAISLGMVRYELKDMKGDLTKLENQLSKKIILQGVVVDEPDERENYTRYIVKSENAKILVYTEHYPEFNYGDEIKITGILKKPQDFSQDFSWQDYLAKDDIFYEMFYPEINLAASGTQNNANFIKQNLFLLKQKYLEAIAQVLPEPHAAFMGGLTVGAKKSIPKELQEDFRKTGIIHVVVLSGYNITLVADTIVRIFSFLPKTIGLSFGVLGIIFFAIMTGASATVVRASLMALLVILARTTGRIYQITWALILTGFFMVLYNPKILIFDTGFQLSFLATFALIQLAPYFEKKLKFITNKWKLREIASATLATQIFVLPLLLYKMGLFSLVALPVNLLILIFVPITMFFGFTAGIVGLFSTILSIPFGWISYAFLQYELWVVEIFAKLPFASFSIEQFPLFLMIIIYIFYAIIILKIKKNEKL